MYEMTIVYLLIGAIFGFIAYRNADSQRLTYAAGVAVGWPLVLLGLFTIILVCYAERD